MATEVNASIGATGRDHSDLPTWESATDDDPVGADEQRNGNMHDDADFTSGLGAALASGTVDSTRFRRLRVAAGDEYDPVADTGIWITVSGAGIPLNLNEGFFEVIGGIGCEQTDTGSAGTRQCAISSTNGDDVLFNRVYATIGSGGTGPRYGFRYTVGTGINIRNCIAVGPGADNVNNNGFEVLEATGNVLHNCVAHNWSNNSNGNGVSGTCERKNVISTDSGNNDFNGTGGTIDHCASSDATATGTGSFTNQAATNLFEDPASNDFHLKDGSVAADNGTDLSGTFTDDFDGDTRSGDWDMGVYTALGSARRFYLVD